MDETVEQVEPAPALNRRVAFAIMGALALVTTGIAAGLAVWRGVPVWSYFDGGVWTIGRQVTVGGAAGAMAGVLVTLVTLGLPVFEPARRVIREAARGYRPTMHDAFALSLLAGWGEELLFRGLLQPWLGLWPTSILFAVLHGAVDVRTWRRALLVVYYVGAGALLGWCAQAWGLAAAMSAHFFADWVMLGAIVVWSRREGARRALSAD